MPATPRDPEVERLINEHLEAVDRALATRGLPLAERRSVTDDVEAQMREMLAERAGGAPAAADVEAVLGKLDPPESYAEGAEGTSAAVPAEPARLSRLAILGAAWSPLLFLLPCLSLLIALRVAHGGRSAWAMGAWYGFVVLGMAGPFATTILGWVAVLQIRRSSGRLCGLGLALADGLLYPLLALDVLTYVFWRAVVAVAISSGTWGFFKALGRPSYSGADQNRLLLFVLTALTSLLVDWLIVRWVWRRLRVPAGQELVRS